MHTQLEDLKRKRQGGVLRDGEVHHVPLMMMDSVSRAIAEGTGFAAAEATMLTDTTANNRPHFAAQSDEDRERRQQLYADAEAKLCDRWKNPPPLAADIAKPVEAKPTGDAKQDSYDRYDRNIAERWRATATA